MAQNYFAVCGLNIPLIRKLLQFEANSLLHDDNRLYRSFESFRNEKIKNSSVLTITRYAEEISLYTVQSVHSSFRTQFSLYTVQTDSCQGIETSLEYNENKSVINVPFF